MPSSLVRSRRTPLRAGIDVTSRLNREKTSWDFKQSKNCGAVSARCGPGSAGMQAFGVISKRANHRRVQRTCSSRDADRAVR